jgi:hypothetical protein
MRGAPVDYHAAEHRSTPDGDSTLALAHSQAWRSQPISICDPRYNRSVKADKPLGFVSLASYSLFRHRIF